MGAVRYSVVAAFKNRDEQRVKFFLDSLKWQTNQAFELIFVNQGSNADVNAWLYKLISKYPFIRYFHNRTEGHLWSKSNALNIGIKSAIGEYIIIADIDVIFPNDYLVKVTSLLSPNVFITHDAYYLPEECKYGSLGDLNEIKASSNLAHHFIGVCVAKRDRLISIKGYDEYFLVWGGEDDDIINKLEAAGEKRLHVSADEIHIFHQWHKTVAPATADFWFLDILQRLYVPKGNVSTEISWGNIIERAQRPVLDKIDRLSLLSDVVRLTLIPHPTFQFNQFYISFKNLKSGQIALFDYQESSDYSQNTKLAFFVNFFNKVLEWKNYKYRLSIKNSSKSFSHNYSFIDSFIKYFIGKNRFDILDYYYLSDNNKIQLILIKK
jgi:glycosyltransferase involved in cell wall biosynthesis